MNMNARHSIAVVSQRTGLPQDLLRAWERRYGTVVPSRTESGRRRYTDEDVERLSLIRELLAGDHRISDVAALSRQELLELLRQRERDRSESRSGAAGQSISAREEAPELEELQEAVRASDATRLRFLLDKASVALSLPQLLERHVLPLLEWIGSTWQRGELRICQEHLASAVLRTYLGSLLSRRRAAPGAPRLVATTPSGQRHELGALMAALSAQEAGWEVAFLGADLPAEDIASLSLDRQARVVALGIVVHGGEGRTVSEVLRLRELLHPGQQLILGGRDAGACHRALPPELDVKLVQSLDELRSLLAVPPGS